MKRIIFVFIFCLTLFNLKATTVYPKKQTCPVCQKIFITYVIGSYYSSGATRRDLRDSSIFRFRKIITCPYCLYSSLNSDFNNIHQLSVIKLRKELPKIKLNLHPKEKEEYSKFNPNYRTVRLLLARECNKLRGENKKRNMRLLLYAFYISSHRNLKKLNPFYRKRSINLLTSLLNEKQYEGKEEAALTYLLGELNRLDGNHKLALGCFKKATALSENFFISKNWIKQFSYEQSCRITYLNLSIIELATILRAPDTKKLKDGEVSFNKKLALEILSNKSDMDSWKIISDYVIQDVERLYCLSSITELTKKKLQTDKELWLFAQKQYKKSLREFKVSGNNTNSIWIQRDFAQFFEGEDPSTLTIDQQLMTIIKMKNGSICFNYIIKPKDTFQSIKNKFLATPERILELNPHIKSRDKILSEKTIKLIRVLEKGFESNLLNYVAKQIQIKTLDAVNYFFTWVNSINSYSISSFRYSILKVLKALKSNNIFWEIPHKDTFATNTHSQFIYDCLLFIKDQKESNKKLLKHINNKSFSNIDIVVKCMKMRNDKGAKNKVFEYLKSDVLYPGFDVLSYLEWASTIKDLPAIKKLIKMPDDKTSKRDENHMQSYRKDIERVITNIKINVNFKHYLKRE